ncbi:MAG: sterol desaturase family protein [Proteobacteria bacterium]|nr:sterol desaturase family protein [Pseudomonadota bacterium]
MSSGVGLYLAQLAWIFPLTAVFCIFEHLSPAATRPTWRNRLENCAYLALALPLVMYLQSLFNPLFEQAMHVADSRWIGHLHAFSQTLPGTILVTIAYALIWDTWHYWIHRWQHASPFLWETHKFHHGDPMMNATTQGRRHLLDYLLSLICHAPMLLVLGSLNPTAFVGVLMFRFWGFVNHANLRVSFGPLAGVISGPQWHRIHHSALPQHRSKNFATFFPFIDKLFGTHYAPAAGEYPPTGLPDAPPESFVRSAAHSPLAVWYRHAQQFVADRRFLRKWKPCTMHAEATRAPRRLRRRMKNASAFRRRKQKGLHFCRPCLMWLPETDSNRRPSD